jgi:hypothetical protein
MTLNDKLNPQNADGSLRSHLSSIRPAMEGGSYFFEVKPGWETRVLRDDRKVTTVLSVEHLEEALADPTVSAIFIPADATILKVVARRICRKQPRVKTVFFEERD